MPEGAIVVFSAHGVAPSVHEEAARARPAHIDATCPLVTKVHHEAKRFAARGLPRSCSSATRVTRRSWARRARRPSTSRSSTARPASTRRGAGPREVAWLSQTTLSVDETDADGAARCARGSRSARPAERRHLLRHPEPAGRGQGDRRRLRPGHRRRLAQLLELRTAGRGGARGGRPAAYLVDDAGRARRRLARGRHAPSGSPAGPRCRRSWCAACSTGSPSAASADVEEVRVGGGEPALRPAARAASGPEGRVLRGRLPAPDAQPPAHQHDHRCEAGADPDARGPGVATSEATCNVRPDIVAVSGLIERPPGHETRRPGRDDEGGDEVTSAHLQGGVAAHQHVGHAEDCPGVDGEPVDDEPDEGGREDDDGTPEPSARPRSAAPGAW